MSSKKPMFRKEKIYSGREWKRMHDKQERAEEKIQKMEQFLKLPPEERAKLKKINDAVERIQRNGISIDDLRENHNIGYSEGWKAACEFTMKTCYAAMCMAAHDLYGFGGKRCYDMLQAMDKNVVYSLDSETAINEVWEKFGLKIDFKNPFPGDRIESEVD